MGTFVVFSCPMYSATVKNPNQYWAGVLNLIEGVGKRKGWVLE
jgi:hypothetical protein